MFDNMYSKLSTVLKYINGKFTFAENLQFYEDKFGLTNRRATVPPNYKKKKNLQFKTHKKCISSGLKTSFP